MMLVCCFLLLSGMILTFIVSKFNLELFSVNNLVSKLILLETFNQNLVIASESRDWLKYRWDNLKILENSKFYEMESEWMCKLYCKKDYNHSCLIASWQVLSAGTRSDHPWCEHRFNFLIINKLLFKNK